jgi:hypothetical protein
MKKNREDGARGPSSEICIIIPTSTAIITIPYKELIIMAMVN